MLPSLSFSFRSSFSSALVPLPPRAAGPHARLAGTLLVCALAAGCATEPVTGRWQFLAFPEGQLNEMGALSYQEALGQVALSKDSQANALVERVGRRIALVADRRLRAEGREVYAWEFKVVEAPETVNAFALPGGKVAFYTGILPICQGEAGVAAVMGHEVAHAYAQHGNERVSRATAAAATIEAAAIALGSGETTKESTFVLAALGLGYQVGVELPFSRTEESSADHIGLILMAEAGYDPREAVAFWERMRAAGGADGTPEFLRTHPTHETRIRQLEEWLPEAVAVYAEGRGIARTSVP
jgi:predicted Zn-dependent protease